MKLSKLVDRFNKFYDVYQDVYKMSKQKLWIDFLINYLIYGCSLRDYFTLEFPFKNRVGKKRIITSTEIINFYKKNNDIQAIKLLNDKEECLKLFDKYTRRSWIGVKYNNSEEECMKFVDRNEKCIIKPMIGCGGGGVSIQNVSEIDDIRVYCTRNNVLIEELIKQHKEMNRLSPNAVNTIRVFTYRKKCVGAVLRIGTGKACVDNASSGGIFARIDMESGIICSVARDYYTPLSWTVHPNTKISIVGFKIPYWEEVNQMVEEAAAIINGVPLVGWDVAISENGPVLVEANAEGEIVMLQIAGIINLKEILQME